MNVIAPSMRELRRRRRAALFLFMIAGRRVECRRIIIIIDREMTRLTYYTMAVI